MYNVKNPRVILYIQKSYTVNAYLLRILHVFVFKI